MLAQCKLTHVNTNYEGVYKAFVLFVQHESRDQKKSSKLHAGKCSVSENCSDSDDRLERKRYIWC